MDTVRKRTTLVSIATLIVGLALGLGIGIWGVRSTQASSGPAKVSSASSPHRTGTQDETFGRSDDWDPFRQMERMQREIDQAIRDATERFQVGPNMTAFRPDAGYSSQFDLRDRNDDFELRAYLPDADASDVNVKIENDRTLHVSVVHKKQEMKKDSAHEASVAELGQYEQVVTLPEAVKSSDMKVERNGHEVIITIPKAKRT